MREKVGKSRNTVFFQWFVAPEGRKVGSLKRRVRSQLARWEMKKCTPLWREAHFEVKRYKAHHSRTTFGSWDVEKVHAVVARSTFPSQNVQNTPFSDHFWKLRRRKSARRSGAKHISKSKCTKHTRSGPLLAVETLKKCTPLWREAHFQVKMYKAPHVRATFGASPGRWGKNTENHCHKICLPLEYLWQFGLRHWSATWQNATVPRHLAQLGISTHRWGGRGTTPNETFIFATCLQKRLHGLFTSLHPFRNPRPRQPDMLKGCAQPPLQTCSKWGWDEPLPIMSIFIIHIYIVTTQILESRRRRTKGSVVGEEWCQNVAPPKMIHQKLFCAV